MYSRNDIIRLQQIVFLKSMGFSLEEIRDRMLPAESAAELEQLFIKQKEILLEEISHIQETVSYMCKIIDEIKQGSEIDIDRLLIIVRAIQKGNPYSFMFRYINKNQMEYFFNCIENEEAANKLNKSFQGISEELIELCSQNEKPEGLKGQEVASRWWNLMISLTKGDVSFIQDLAIRHPEKIKILMAHEPPLTHLLSGEERIKARQIQDNLEKTARCEGVIPAMKQFASVLGMENSNNSAHRPSSEQMERMIGNMKFFVMHEAPVIRRHMLDVEKLKAALNTTSMRILTGGGSTSPNSFPYLCAIALAEQLGVEMVNFPGNHLGYVNHSEEFAGRLHEALKDEKSKIEA